MIEIPPFSHVKETDATPDGAVPGQEPSVFYYAVFDGHGGDAASLFLKDYLHRYIEESSKLFNPSNEIRGAVLAVEPRPNRDEETDMKRSGREKRAEMQMDLINTWKDVGGYFRRFKPDFGGVRGCGFKDGDGGIEAVLMYAFLRADHDFITGTRPWFLPPEEGAQIPAQPPEEKLTKFKGGSTASVLLLSPS